MKQKCHKIQTCNHNILELFTTNRQSTIDLIEITNFKSLLYNSPSGNCPEMSFDYLMNMRHVFCPEPQRYNPKLCIYETGLFP